MDVCGNVWEWTSSPYPVPSGEQERRIVKGESYLCADNYCMRYRPSAVMGQTLDTTGVNDGLRNLAMPILVALENLGDVPIGRLLFRAEAHVIASLWRQEAVLDPLNGAMGPVWMGRSLQSAIGCQ